MIPLKKLVIVCTHPIQYYVPVFRLIAASGKVELHVLYTKGEEDPNGNMDMGFGKTFVWDIPLLEGYSSTFLANTAADPGSHHFNGIDNPDILRQIESIDPDALLVYGWAYKSHLKVLRRFKSKIPILFRGDSTLLDEVPGIKTLLRRVFLRWVYRHVDKALYVGTQNKNYFIKHGLTADRLIFAPHAVDNKRFGEATAGAISKNSMGIPEDHTVILFAGKLIRKKDPLILLRAFEKLSAPNTALVITGNGMLESTLKKAAENIRGVHFLDFQNQSRMPSVYGLADLFCMPSAGPGESWGLAVNEAMASGKAILVSDKAGCAADLVRPGINGDIFKAGDIQDLIKKLEHLLSDKARLKTMGRESEKIISGWTPEIQSANIIDTVLRF